jgi:hypothetical protein
MVRNVVFVDLDHRPPRPLFVIEFGFSADSDDTGIIRGDCDETVERIWRDGLKLVRTSLKQDEETHDIGIHHENILVKRRINANEFSHLMVDLKLQRVHRSIEVNAVEIMQEQDLRIALATITRALTFVRLSDFDGDHITMESWYVFLL